MMIEKPPIRRGTVDQQVAALHDYLYRLAASLEPAIEQANSIATASSQSVSTKTAATIRDTAYDLQSLIIKSADTVHQYVDQRIDHLSEDYVAYSEYGTFVRNINTTIEETARSLIASYNFVELIQGLQQEDQTLQQYLTELTGQIQRGIVWDRMAGHYVTGIAISQELRFGADPSRPAADQDKRECPPTDPNNPDYGSANAHTYYYMESGQTFGLYTSTGWQFWMDNTLGGWFDNASGFLHVRHLVIEESLRVGTFMWMDASGLGLKYIGA